jgi:tRNA1(Val) A37 N6-methylase TrmN6
MSKSARTRASDSYYTPFPIALRLVAYAGPRKVTRVLDPACGDGSLLVAAAQRWPQASLLSNDTSLTALESARVRCKPAASFNVNILHAAKTYRLIKRLQREWYPDLVLLNPPFSARSRHRHKVAIGTDLCAYVSQSAAFLLACAQLIRPEAQMVAVMPESFLSSVRDQVARELIQRLGVIDVVEKLPRRAFRGCRAATIILTFSRSREHATRLPMAEKSAVSSGLVNLINDLVRGNVPVHETKAKPRKGRRRFLHTTHIKDGRTRPVLRCVPDGARTVAGPVVLIPRVGMATSAKIVSADFRHRVVISDCLYALKTDTAEDAETLRNAIVSEWPSLQREYTGTGAPHMRTDALLAVLERIPLTSQTVRLAGNGGV